MARYEIPEKIGKVRLAMSLGGKFTVWNGKQGRGEFRIVCRNRKEAAAAVERINRKEHEGFINL